MKKILNDVNNLVDEMLNGMVKSHGDIVAKVPNASVLVRAKQNDNKVKLISGGGSGHEPSHGGFVGEGMLDAAVAGEVFSSPGSDQVLEAINAVGNDKGVLLIIKNYTGDVINFEMAGEMSEVPCEKVVVNDDIALENSTYTVGRRGIAGTIYIHKIAGAKAELGASLSEVKEVAERVIDNVYSMGMSLGPCIVPASGKASFELGEKEVEMGLGIHGEPGTHRMQIESADQHVEYMLGKIFDEMKPQNGDRVGVLVNGLGGTPLMELYVVANKVQDMLKDKGIAVVDSMVGNYMTSIEMAGFSISVVKLDEETEKLLMAKADTIAWKRF